MAYKAAYKDRADAERRGASVEIYRTPSQRAYGYRVIAAAEDCSAQALRDAKAVALEIEQELETDLAERGRADVVAVRFPADEKTQIKDLAADQGINPSEFLRRIVAAHLADQG